MRRYLIALVVIALLAGSFFRSAEQSGSKIMNMFGVLAIFLLGILGTMAAIRWQSRTGLKETEAALKSLEPDCVLTDWYSRGGGRPDYLVVGPGGMAAVCVDETPGNWSKKRAAAAVAAARGRAQNTVDWLRDRLGEAAPEVKGPLGDSVHDLPSRPIVVLTRRPATAAYTVAGVTVLNADQLAAHVRSLWERPLLSEQDRIQLTRLLRRLGA
ncbi:MAG TPA: hypothetical protein VGK74_01840 [Symbiobacteriaceae bacterium]|jgi:hypothetical protein